MGDGSDTRVCAGPDCDVEFTPRRKDHIYHHANCRKEAYRVRKLRQFKEDLVERFADVAAEVAKEHFGDAI